MENKGMISVIIPTYNRAKLVVKSIRSVLDQTYKNIEVIVIDDNSSDDTRKRIKKINDKRLRYYKLRKNHGACYARNMGINKARGEYIAFQDSDDIFYKEKLELQLNNLIKNNSYLDFCKLHVNVDNNCWEFPGINEERNIVKGKILDELCNGNIISTQAILVKKAVLVDIMFDETLPRFQDYDLVLRIASKYKISYTKLVLAEVYRQNDSISASDVKLKDACFKMFKKKYNLNKNQQFIFEKTLFSFLIKNERDKVTEISDKYEKLMFEYTSLSNNYSQLQAKYDKLYECYSNRFIIKISRFINRIIRLKK